MNNTQPTRLTLDKRLISFINSLEREECNVTRVNKLVLIDEKGLKQLRDKGYCAQTISVIDSFIRLSFSLHAILVMNHGGKVVCGNKSFSNQRELNKYIQILRTKKSKLLKYEIESKAKEESRQ